MSTEVLHLPIDTEESAHFGNSDDLLPRQLYIDLSKLVKEALDKAKPISDDNKRHRSHHAVLIDGERGSGKTSVLVNLSAYIEENNETKSFFNDLMILDPIDPTLLEDGDSLFLTIIVASVLSNEALKEKQKYSPEKAAELNRSLDKLATALESAEPDSDAKGMQKIRNMFDNNNLETCVRSFFDSVLRLMGKQLLVLPIDDVDTSLNRAFENLEIVRRYLTSPNVLPIIAGDLKLYQQVIWRDFHGRMTKESHYNNKQAFETAQDLANEYQRKVMPLSRRLVMPGVDTYLSEQKGRLKIILVKGDNVYMSLANFYAWLEIFLSGPVNGLEDSTLRIPIKSIRALTQLLNRCQELIPELPDGITNATSKLQVKRCWQMPNVPTEVIEEFHGSYYMRSNEAQAARYYADIYKEFGQNVPTAKLERTDFKEFHLWIQTLSGHFMHEKDAGALNLVLRAYDDWYKLNYDGPGLESVLDSPIFQPLLQNRDGWENFIHSFNLDDWLGEERANDIDSVEKGLKNKLPEAWLQKLQYRTTMLPYPLPQVGTKTNASWQNDQSYKDKKDALFTLLTNYNFYSNSEQSQMLNSGRIFEIMIHSLVAPLDISSLQRIAYQAPFYSTSDLAPTKNHILDVDDAFNDNNNDVGESDISGLIELSEKINEWRQHHNLDNFRLSPWLVYKVLNKVFGQLIHFPSAKTSDEAYRKASLDLLAFTFNTTWAAFASFEKGPLFGLPATVATTNINSDSGKNFQSNPHFHRNINPFTPKFEPLLKLREEQKEEVKGKSSEANNRDTFGRCTNTVTHMLSDHPLRIWINEILVSRKEEEEGDKPKELGTPHKPKVTNRLQRYDRFLKSNYHLTLPKGKILTEYIEWIASMENGLALCYRILQETREDHNGSELFKLLEKAVNKLKQLDEKE